MDKFSYEANGYSRREVNDFVEDVIKRTEGIINKCNLQTAEVERLKSEIERYKQMESSLHEALIKAEETSDSVKMMAREEATMIITDAKHNANRIVNEALLKAEKIEAQSDTLERNMRIFKRKLKLIMEQQQAVVDEIEVLELE